MIQDDVARESAIRAGQSICRDVFSGDVVLERCLDVYRHAIETTQTAAAERAPSKSTGVKPVTEVIDAQGASDVAR